MKYLLSTTILLSSFLTFSQSLHCNLHSNAEVLSTSLDLTYNPFTKEISTADEQGYQLQIEQVRKWKEPRKTRAQISNYSDFRSVSISLIKDNNEIIIEEFTYMSKQNGIMLSENFLDKSIICTSDW